MLLASCSYFPRCLKKGCSLHRFMVYLRLLWSAFRFRFTACGLRTPSLSAFLLHLSPKHLDIWLHVDTCGIFFLKLLSPCFVWGKWFPSFGSSHFFLRCSQSSRCQRCHGKLAPLRASAMESMSCSFQPLISVPDIVPRVLIEINSLDTEAHLWCPVVLSHVRTAHRIFLNCFPSWDEIFGNQVEHLM